MKMLDVRTMTESAEACLGWPYVSPGSNDARGIDCSGLFVKIYRDQGASIYHGSNTIYRKYCVKKGKLKSVGQLQEGMAVFKWNPNTPEKFGDGLGDFQHIGYVAGVNPLRIIHASTGTMNVTTDNRIGRWQYWGKLKDVDYGGSTEGGGTEDGSGESGDREDETEMDAVLYKARLQGGNTARPINIRMQPDGALKDTVPQGTLVEVLDESGNWCKVRYGKNRTGYVLGDFVEVADEDGPAGGSTEGPGGSTEGPGGDGDAKQITISLTMTAEQAANLLPALEKLVDAIADKAGRG